MKKIKQVAIGILLQQQRVLLAWRDERLHQGGCYEFAGGKIEHGETPIQACRREILEEVGIDLEHWIFFDKIVHEYDDVIVHLHIYQSFVPLELNISIDSRWHWVTRQDLKNYEFPAANQTIIQRLIWRPYIKIGKNLTDVLDLSDEYLFYWRVDLTQNLQQNIDKLQQLAMEYPEKLQHCIINQSIWFLCSKDIQHLFKTLHLKQSQLQDYSVQKIDGVRYIVACHDQCSLQSAIEWGADAVFCSPIFATETHPQQQGIGWILFQQWVKNYPLPVFALGGLKHEDLSTAQQYGAYGVAGIRWV